MLTGIILTDDNPSGGRVSNALVDYEGAPSIIQIMVKLSYVCDKLIVVPDENKNEIKHAINNYLKSDIIVNEENLLKEKLLKIKNSIEIIDLKKTEMRDIGFLKAGLAKADKNRWVLYHTVDQPGLPYSFYEDFVIQIENGFDWVQPMYRTKPGLPILLNSTVFNSIMKFDENKSLKEYSQKTHLNKKFWNCSYSQVLPQKDSLKLFTSSKS